MLEFKQEKILLVGIGTREKFTCWNSNKGKIYVVELGTIAPSTRLGLGLTGVLEFERGKIYVLEFEQGKIYVSELEQGKNLLVGNRTREKFTC